MDVFTKEELDMFRANTRNIAPFPKQQAAPKKKSNFFVNNLNAIGSGLGAVAGIPLAPFTGGASIIAGGALGGALGETAKRSLRDESLDLKEIGIQGLIGGATAGIGGGAAKGASTAAKSFVGGASKKAAQNVTPSVREGVFAGARKQAEKQAAEVTQSQPLGVTAKLNNFGQGLRSTVSNTSAGTTQRGTSARITVPQSAKMQSYLDEIGAKGSAAKQAELVSQDLERSGQAIRGLVEAVDAPLKKTDINAIRTTAMAKKPLGFKADDPLIIDVDARLKAPQTLSSLRDLRGEIDDTLKSFYSKGERNTATTTATERILKRYRDGIDKTLKDRVPGFREANSRYSMGLKAEQQLLRNANPSGINIFGLRTGVGGESIQKAQDLVGRGVQKVTQATVPETPLNVGAPSNVLRNLAIDTASFPLRAAVAPIANPVKSTVQVGKQLGVRGLGNLVAGGESEQVPQDYEAAASQALSLPAEFQETTDPGESSSFFSDPARVEAAYLKALQSGNSEAANAILKGFDLFGAKKEKGQSTASAKTTSTAQSGLDSLATVAKLSEGGVSKGTLIPGRGLFGNLGGNVLGTAEYDQAVKNVADAITRLRTGAAATEYEIKLYGDLLPKAFDSPEVRAQKIRTFQDFFTPIIQSSGGGSAELEDALAGVK